MLTRSSERILNPSRYTGCNSMYVKNELIKNKQNKTWKALLVAKNAPKDKDTEMYAHIFYLNYLINKVILVEFPGS